MNAPRIPERRALFVGAAAVAVAAGAAAHAAPDAELLALCTAWHRAEDRYQAASATLEEAMFQVAEPALRQALAPLVDPDGRLFAAVSAAEEAEAALRIRIGAARRGRPAWPAWLPRRVWRSGSTGRATTSTSSWGSSATRRWGCCPTSRRWLDGRPGPGCSAPDPGLTMIRGGTARTMADATVAAVRVRFTTPTSRNQLTVGPCALDADDCIAHKKKPPAEPEAEVYGEHRMRAVVTGLPSDDNRSQVAVEPEIG